MKVKRILCAALLIALAACVPAQASRLEQAWMTYEDYSGNRAEQTVTDEATLDEIEEILTSAYSSPAQMEECTLNCTLFVQVKNGDIYDFACATDGCPFIQNRDTDQAYTLGDDFTRFWDIFWQVRQGMGLEASQVFGAW